MVELSRTQLLAILVLSFTIASILITLPAQYEKEEENRRGGTTTTTTRTRKPTLVPTVIFNTLPPSSFQAFVIALVFAFASSLSALLLHDAENHTGKRGKISRLVTRLFGCVSLASITFALAILSWALLLTAAACWPPSFSRSLLDLPKRFYSKSIGKDCGQIWFSFSPAAARWLRSSWMFCSWLSFVCRIPVGGLSENSFGRGIGSSSSLVGAAACVDCVVWGFYFGVLLFLWLVWSP